MIGRPDDANAFQAFAWQRAVIAVLLLGWLASQASALGEISTDDRGRAEQLAKRAIEAQKASDSFESCRLLLRAVRWDPARREDYQTAIEELSGVNPAAALRHTQQALAADAAFGEDNPALLLRLVAAARDAESWKLSAQLARRHREAILGQPRVSRRRRAELELSVSRLEFLAGEVNQASEGFERLRRLRYGLPVDEPIAGSPLPWRFAIESHLAAGQPNNAEDALVLWERQSGETAEVASMRARLALVRGKPLAAIGHATRAVEFPGEVATAENYHVLIDAYVAANQTTQAKDWLREASRNDPDQMEITMALVEALGLCGEQREAFEESGRLVARLLTATEPFDRLFGSRSLAKLAVDRRSDLASAAEQWIDTAITLGETDPVLDQLPALAARLGGLQTIAGAVGRLVDRPESADDVRAWLRKAVTRSAQPNTPAGLRQAGGWLALRQDDVVTHKAFVEARVDVAFQKGVDLTDIEHEVGIAVATLIDRGQYVAAQTLARRAIERLTTAAEELSEDAGPLLVTLRVDLAEAIAFDLPKSEPARRRAVEEATQLLRRSREEAVQDAYVTRTELQVFAECGLVERAIDAGESILRSKPAGDRSVAIEASYRREAALLLDSALTERDSPSDSERRVEVLELILDEWPNDTAALTRLAKLFAEQGQHLVRAERMARRAVVVEPATPSSLAALAWVRYRRNDATEAVDLLQRAVSRIEAGADLSPAEERTIRDRYAEVLATLGRAEQAEAISP